MALYPPIVASSMPAFGIVGRGTGVATIYFSLSEYNRRSEIKSVQVSVRRQSSNSNVLKSATQIVKKSLSQKKEDKNTNRYYITLRKADLNGYWENNVFYKVQLRFDGASEDIENITAQYLKNNAEKFSQWSTVTLIKPIIKPTFYIDEFKPEESEDFEEQNETNYFYSTLADFVGVYSPGEGSRQKLKSWRLRLLDNSYEDKYYSNINTYTLADSGEVTINAYNYVLNEDNTLVFTCSLPYEFKTNNQYYKLLLEIQTRNGYTEKKLIEFISSIATINKPQVALSYSINEEDGYVKINIENNNISATNIVLRRTDSSSNFLKWEDLKFYTFFPDGEDVVSYYDFTVQSGTVYKYLVQGIDIRGRRSSPVYAQYQSDGGVEQIPGVLLEYDHAFLLEDFGNGNIQEVKQLKLKFDFQISSYKQNILESKTDTLGSQYPFIKRNGDMYYRSFDCSGTITGFMDEAELFVSKNNLYDNKKDLYDMFKGEITNYIDQYDYTYERKFREKVEEFLYNSKPKLYKSMQEGNIFIKLMNVSLSPKNELGRLIYTFSATAYQIDQAEIKTYMNYGLLSPGTYDTALASTKEVLGQLNSYDISTQSISKYFEAGKDVIGAVQASAANENTIASKLNYLSPASTYVCIGFDIDWLRITVESPPYLIVKEGSQYRPVDDIGSDRDIIQDPTNTLYQMEKSYSIFNNDTLSEKEIYLGTLFDLTINNETQSIIVAPPNNIYELNQPNLILEGASSKLVPRKNTLMSIDYHLISSSQEDESAHPIKVRIQNVNGQLEMAHFDANTNIVSCIKYKYLYNNQTDNGKMNIQINGIKSILIDTEPGTKVKIITTGNLEEEFIINHTGELNIDLSNQNQNYITSYIIQDSVDALIFYCASVQKSYYI